MTSSSGEYFGSETQKGLQQRAENLWELVRDDSRFCCYGRGVGLSDFTEDNLSTQLALARLQGACLMVGLLGDTARKRKSDLEAAGLVTDEYACWAGDTGSHDAARSVLQR
jgi:hypothetical protein